MADKSNYKTPQEEFWAGQFGNEYISRNDSVYHLASNLNFFSKALGHATKIDTCIEFGANIGLNLRALKLLQPSMEQYAVEINSEAVKILKPIIGNESVFEGSIFDYEALKTFDLSLIKGVLIHIIPDMLPKVYEQLYKSSSKYILIAEYYNPSPVTVQYRGHSDRLFKRDFAGEIMDIYKDLSLIDYGFVYQRDPVFPQDDITWFLLEKK